MRWRPIQADAKVPIRWRLAVVPLHLPLVPALSRLASVVRPGGTLAAVALPRRDLLHELPDSTVALLGRRS